MAESINLDSFELSRFFLALVLLLAFSHSFGHLFARFKLPRVVGEISGGILLGPSALGHFSPSAYHWVFDAFEAEGKLISMIYWLGLVLLMFISGFEVQKSLGKRDISIITALILGSTVVPFLAGWSAPYFYDFSPYLGEKNNLLALQIVVAIAMAVTSIPVISRIFLDLNIIDTPFAKIVLASATLHDVMLWIALAFATSLVNSVSPSVSTIGASVLATLVFFAVSLLIMPKIINYSAGWRFNLLLKSSVSGYVFFLCFLFSAAASLLDVNIVFGAFLAGIVVGRLPDEKFQKQRAHIQEISLSVFVPVYFAIVGLKLDLVHHFDPAFLMVFLAFSTLVEGAGVLISAKALRFDWLSCVNFAAAMNTRGGPGIVLATVAFDLGIINETFFVALVLIAVLTSLAAGYWFRYVLSKGWHLMKLPSEFR